MTSTRAALAALVLAAALAAGFAARAPQAPAGVAEPPNVLVVMTDDQRLDDLAVMPQTRRLVGARGVTFNHAFATFPLCCPSRATYLTGQYAHNHGVRDNTPPNGGAAAFRESGLEESALPVALDGAGYRTGWLGKYLNGYTQLAREEPPYVPPGWDVWGAQVGSGKMLDWQQMWGGEVRRWGTEPRDYQTDVLARQASSFIRQSAAKGSPFFLTVTPLAPHTERRGIQAARNPRPAPRHREAFVDDPLPRSAAFNEADVSDKPAWVRALPRLDRDARQRVRRQRNDRRASLLAVDDLVERTVATLRAEGELDETLLLFTSDNGYLLGEHRVRFGKAAIYDEAARVPLLARGPGMTQGLRVGAPVGNVDLAATIHDATGVAPLLEGDGVSLLDVVADRTAFRNRDLVLETRSAAAVRNRHYLYAEHGQGSEAEVELYDLNADPFQLDSLHSAPAYAAERAALANRLEELRDCEGEGCA